MSKVVSLRLSDEQVDQLQRMARERNQTLSRTAAMLVEEGLRMAAFPGIEFRNSPIIRQAYVKGTRITPWFLEILARAYDRDLERIAAHLAWPVHQVQAGLAYAEAFPDEIEAAIAENASYDEERLRRIFPQLQVIKMSNEQREGEEGAGAARDVASAAR